MILVCEHTSTDTYWGVNASGGCDPFHIPSERVTLHADQVLAIVGGVADGFAGGFSLVFSAGVVGLLMTALVIKAILRVFV